VLLVPGCANSPKTGLLKANFVPLKPIRQLRNLTRYRKTQIQERAREGSRPRAAVNSPAAQVPGQ
jgi:hypothetical protein